MNKFTSRFLSRPFSYYSHSLPSSSDFRFLTLTARTDLSTDPIIDSSTVSS